MAAGEDNTSILCKLSEKDETDEERNDADSDEDDYDSDATDAASAPEVEQEGADAAEAAPETRYRSNDELPLAQTHLFGLALQL